MTLFRFNCLENRRDMQVVVCLLRAGFYIDGSRIPLHAVVPDLYFVGVQVLSDNIEEALHCEPFRGRRDPLRRFRHVPFIRYRISAT